MTLLSLINDVLNFARLETGRREYGSEPVPIGPLLDGLDDFVAPQVERKGLAYRRSSCGSYVVALGDPERIQQILLNLLTNAVKFTGRGGRIEVDAQVNGERVVVRVADTGRGIPPDRRQSIFDPFVQVDRHRTEESQQGVGLGLAIRRDLARGMGGDLSVESSVGQGSTFALTLPVADGARD